MSSSQKSFVSQYTTVVMDITIKNGCPYSHTHTKE